MRTYEMLALADENGKTYRSCDMYYQKDKGFTDCGDVTWDVLAFNYRDEDGLNYFAHLDDWQEVKSITRLDYFKFVFPNISENNINKCCLKFFKCDCTEFDCNNCLNETVYESEVNPKILGMLKRERNI